MVDCIWYMAASVDFGGSFGKGFQAPLRACGVDIRQVRADLCKVYGGFHKLVGPSGGCPDNDSPAILGLIFGPPDFWKLPYGSKKISANPKPVPLNFPNGEQKRNFRMSLTLCSGDVLWV